MRNPNLYLVILMLLLSLLLIMCVCVCVCMCVSACVRVTHAVFKLLVHYRALIQCIHPLSLSLLFVFKITLNTVNKLLVKSGRLCRADEHRYLLCFDFTSNSYLQYITCLSDRRYYYTDSSIEY